MDTTHGFGMGFLLGRVRHDRDYERWNTGSKRDARNMRIVLGITRDPLAGSRILAARIRV